MNEQAGYVYADDINVYADDPGQAYYPYYDDNTYSNYNTEYDSGGYDSGGFDSGQTYNDFTEPIYAPVNHTSSGITPETVTPGGNIWQTLGNRLAGLMSPSSTSGSGAAGSNPFYKQDWFRDLILEGLVGMGSAYFTGKAAAEKAKDEFRNESRILEQKFGYQKELNKQTHGQTLEQIAAKREPAGPAMKLSRRRSLYRDQR